MLGLTIDKPLPIKCKVTDDKDYYYRLITFFNTLVSDKTKTLAEQERRFLATVLFLGAVVPFKGSDRKVLKKEMSITEPTCAGLINRLNNKGWIKDGTTNTGILNIIKQKPKYLLCDFTMKS